METDWDVNVWSANVKEAALCVSGRTFRMVLRLT